jgi:hypothetical protein
MKTTLAEIGSELVQASESLEEFSRQRGLINHLFPYVYQASKRMSSRAISRWLEEKGFKLSAATISKALREPDAYWQELADLIEPPARLFAQAHNRQLTEILSNRDLFDLDTEQAPTIAATGPDDASEMVDAVNDAASTLRDDWFELPESARDACLNAADWGIEPAGLAETPAAKA